MFAGDSGNDLEVLLSPIPSVLVAKRCVTVIVLGSTGTSGRAHSVRAPVSASRCTR